MTLDLTLEEHDVMDYVQGRAVEPPSNAPATAKMKYRKGEVKAKIIIVDSIQNKVIQEEELIYLLRPSSKKLR